VAWYVQLHTQHHLVGSVEEIKESDDSVVFGAEQNIDLVGEHLGLVLDQALVDDLDCASFLCFLVDSKLYGREVAAVGQKEENKGRGTSPR
jgi:hypothetical protein